MHRDELPALEAAVKDYLDAIYEGDADKIERVFHKSSALTSVDGGVVKIVPRDEWVTVMRGRASPAARGLSRHDHVLQIDLASATTAFVKLHCAIPPRFFTDYLSFLKIDGRWQVAQKVFAVETRE